MKLALPILDGRISPVLDVAERIQLVDLDHSRSAGPAQTEALLKSALPAARARELLELGVEVLVCGALSAELQAALAAAGVTVLPYVCGEVAEAIRAFEEKRLDQPQYRMPGCCGRRATVRGQHGGGCGRHGRRGCQSSLL